MMSSDIYRSVGIMREDGVGGYSAEFKAQLALEYERGDSLTTIAERHSCSTWTVRHAAKKAGVPMRRPGQPWTVLPEEKLIEIENRYLDGESQQKIGTSLGIHQTVVSRILRVREIPTGNERRGENHPSWKGGRYTGPDGYVLVRDNEFPSMLLSQGYVREHRLVMARHLGRPLSSEETIHHKNGNRADNRIENLELRVGPHGRGATDSHCSTCTCFKDTEA